MIKATIQNSPYCTEIRFPCSEMELKKKLGELGMNPEHLAPMAMVLEIEPSELSVLTDCDVSLDALNYLGKRLDGMDKLERKASLGALHTQLWENVSHNSRKLEYKLQLLSFRK